MQQYISHYAPTIAQGCATLSSLASSGHVTRSSEAVDDARDLTGEKGAMQTQRMRNEIIDVPTTDHSLRLNTSDSSVELPLSSVSLPVLTPLPGGEMFAEQYVGFLERVKEEQIRCATIREANIRAVENKLRALQELWEP